MPWPRRDRSGPSSSTVISRYRPFATCRTRSIPVYFPPGNSGVSSGDHSISQSPRKCRRSNGAIISSPDVGPPCVAPGCCRASRRETAIPHVTPITARIGSTRLMRGFYPVLPVRGAGRAPVNHRSCRYRRRRRRRRRSGRPLRHAPVLRGAAIRLIAHPGHGRSGRSPIIQFRLRPPPSPSSTDRDALPRPPRGSGPAGLDGHGSHGRGRPGRGGRAANGGGVSGDPPRCALPRRALRPARPCLEIGGNAAT